MSENPILAEVPYEALPAEIREAFDLQPGETLRLRVSPTSALAQYAVPEPPTAPAPR